MLGVVGNGLKIAEGGAIIVTIGETGVDAVVGVTVEGDGAAKTEASAEDLASIWNGKMNQIGTHNVLENTAIRWSGVNGRKAYEAVSFTLGVVAAPEGVALKDGMAAVQDRGKIVQWSPQPALADVGGRRREYSEF